MLCKDKDLLKTKLIKNFLNRLVIKNESITNYG